MRGDAMDPKKIIRVQRLLCDAHQLLIELQDDACRAGLRMGTPERNSLEEADNLLGQANHLLRSLHTPHPQASRLDAADSKRAPAA
jgi:hypothetical protein